MKEFRGVAASPGIAIGRAFLYSDDDLFIPEYPIEANDIDHEMERYRTAVAHASGELEQIKARSPADLGFLDAHLLMLQDPEMESQVDIRIARVLKNVE